MQISNATPHALDIVREDGSIVHVEPSGRVLRLDEERVPTGSGAVTRAAEALGLEITRVNRFGCGTAI